MVSKTITTIIMALIVIVVGGYAVGQLGAMPHTFIGEAEFENMEQMQKFQSEVVAAVESAGGQVLSFDLTVLSPPKVWYTLYVPSNTEFEYGKPRISLIGGTIMQIITALVFLGMAIAISIRFIWSESYEH